MDGGSQAVVKCSKCGKPAEDLPDPPPRVHYTSQGEVREKITLDPLCYDHAIKAGFEQCHECDAWIVDELGVHIFLDSGRRTCSRIACIGIASGKHCYCSECQPDLWCWDCCVLLPDDEDEGCRICGAG